MNGIIPLHKPKGMTSHDCVMKLRRLLKMKKIGHTGTLDPEVTGVLPICIGEGTKIIPFLSPLPKTYIAEVCLGQATETEDKEGEVIEEAHVHFPSSAQIEAVLDRFHGQVTQVTPLYSAVKVKGKKLYEYARQNIPVERPSRQINLFNIKKLAENKENNSFTIEVTCSKGTYIRTLCVDIGKALGYPAHMGKLLRTKTDQIQLEETYTFDELENALETNTFEEKLLPLEKMLAHMPTWTVDEKMKIRVLQGQKFKRSKDHPLEEPFKVTWQDKVLAVYGTHPEKADEIKPIRIFNIHKV